MQALASPRRFVLIAAAVAVFVCLAAATANLVVDPFGTYRIVTLPGFNAFKPDKYTRVRLIKALEIRRVRPRAVVLGTSRSHVAIGMTHPGWDAAAEPRYNLAFDGATVHELYLYLRHAEAIRPVRQVVLGLDTWQLDPNPSGVRPDFDAALLDATGDWWRHVTSRIAALRILFSTDTVRASFDTVVRQDEASQDWFAPDGQRLGAVFYHNDNEFMTAGPAAYFLDIDRQEIGFKLDQGPPAHAGHGADTARADFSSLDYIRRIVAFCRAEQIDLRIYITPAHAHQMEISASVGEWPTIEAGKRELVRILTDDAMRHPDARPFPLWDFSGYSSVTMEPVPPAGSRQEMTYYWDSSHFKEAVGDWVLDRLFGVSDPNHPVPSDFGMRLVSANIDAALARIRADQAKYRARHPEDVALIRSMVSKVYQSIPAARRVVRPGSE